MPSLAGCILVAVSSTTQAPHTIKTDSVSVRSDGKTVYVYNCEPGVKEAQAYFAARKRPTPLERR